MRIVSPVFFKEIGQLVVSRKMVGMKAVLLAIMIIAYLFIALSPDFSYEFESGQIGKALFIAISFIELFAMAFFTPIVTCGMVCGEKQSNTLGLLFLTRLKAWHIVQDKGLSRIMFMLFMCLTSLPFMFAALLFGGVETKHIFIVAANILSVILFCGGVSLLCSTIAKKIGSALAMAYTAIFLYMVVLPIFLGIIIAIGRNHSDEWLIVIAAV